MAYWNRPVSGRRFFLWLQLVFGTIACGLILLKWRDLDGWDCLGLVVFAGMTIIAVRELIRDRAAKGR